MANASDEQTWWSGLLSDGADPALAIPDHLWESLVASALDFDTPPPVEDLLPADRPEPVADELSFEFQHDGCSPSDGDAFTDDTFGADTELPDGIHYGGGDHQGLYDDASGDVPGDDP